MTQHVLRKRKAVFSSNGVQVSVDPGTPHFNDSEIVSLRRQLKTNSEEARRVAVQRGARINPRVAAIKGQ